MYIISCIYVYIDVILCNYYSTYIYILFIYIHIIVLCVYISIHTRTIIVHIYIYICIMIIIISGDLMSQFHPEKLGYCGTAATRRTWSKQWAFHRKIEFLMGKPLDNHRETIGKP